MSTIAARAHSGSTLSAPARRAAPARRKKSWLGQLALSVRRRPGRALMVLTFGGIAATILLNAILLQDARHPAPIVSAPEASQTPRSAERQAETPAAAPSSSIVAPVAPAAPMAVPASAPVPPARPSDLASPVRETQIRPPAAVTNVPRSAAAPAPAPAPRAAASRDPIADLINGDLRPPADIRGARSASARREN